MTRLFLPVCLATLVLVSALAHPVSEVPPSTVLDGEPDRCAGIEFDAITSDGKGKHFFFKDDYMWSGFHGPALRSSTTFGDIGHVDAAFRLIRSGNPDGDKVYFFQGEHVSVYHTSLEEGYPKKVTEEFPGVPCHLDAAVECPKPECVTDSVIFFKGSEVYHYDFATRTVKTKAWPLLPGCTSAFRWMDHHYCFHGNNFTRFHPRTGLVVGTYPKDARHYFMNCPNFGHGGTHQLPKCLDIKLDAITSDDAGKTYIFIGSHYTRLSTDSEGMHAFPMNRMWSQPAGGVDAVFSYEDKMYLIKGDQVYIYRAGAQYSLIDGYPKTLQEELGIMGSVDAAFACAGQHTVHIIRGDVIVEVDLSATPRAVIREGTLPLPKTDAALCGPDGVWLFFDATYYKFTNPSTLRLAQNLPKPNLITPTLMPCRISESM